VPDEDRPSAEYVGTLDNGQRTRLRIRYGSRISMAKPTVIVPMPCRPGRWMASCRP